MDLLPQGLTLSSVSLDAALALLALPRELGVHPEDGLPVVSSTALRPFAWLARTQADLQLVALVAEVGPWQ
jgi:DNA topoisomerase-1